MSHIAGQTNKVINRLHKIRGQLNTVEKAITGSDSCANILQQLVACRGAMTSLIVELIEEHIREHVVAPDEGASSSQAEGVRELIEVLRTYLR